MPKVSNGWSRYARRCGFLPVERITCPIAITCPNTERSRKWEVYRWTTGSKSFRQAAVFLETQLAFKGLNGLICVVDVYTEAGPDKSQLRKAHATESHGRPRSTIFDFRLTLEER